MPHAFLLQFQRCNSITKQRALDDMPLYFRRPFDDSQRARMTERTGQHVVLSERCRPGNFQREVDDLMQQLGSKQFYIGRLRTNIDLLISPPSTEIRQ